MPVYEYDLRTTIVREGPDLITDSPAHVLKAMEGAFPDQSVEYFYVLLLNAKNHVLGRHMVTKGTATASLVHPREVYRLAVREGATAIVCVHNHPTGDPLPSQADLRVTRQLQSSGETLDIKLLDHVIIGDPGGVVRYYSFAEVGVL